MSEEAVEVPNPYRAAIVSARDRARPVAADLDDDLRAAMRAMEAGAWVSTLADAFHTDLTGHAAALGRAADGAMSTFDDAVAGQPERVPDHAWQIRWRNLR